MSTKQFKTPRKYGTRDMNMAQEPPSDSDSVRSSEDGSTDISIEAEFDDFMRIMHSLLNERSSTDTSYRCLVESMKTLLDRHMLAVEELTRMQNNMDEKIRDCNDLENKLFTARKLLDKEKHNTRVAKSERDQCQMQISKVRELLFTENQRSGYISDEVHNKLSFLWSNNDERDYNGRYPQLSAIKEVNTTGSLLSDFSYSRSEDDLDCSAMHANKPWKKHRPSSEGIAEPAPKKRRSSGHKVVEIGGSDAVRATTTLTVPKDGPITATSIIESVPKPPHPLLSTVPSNTETYLSVPPVSFGVEQWARGSPLKPSNKRTGRQHCFVQKILVLPDTCGPCQKRIRFGKTALKCKECKLICHTECKELLPTPCIPQINTPTKRNGLGFIGDYTPTTAPMVPSLLIHCINEIELRGLQEIGIYRVPGSEREVKSLKERFLKSRSAPNLNQIDIHVICGVVKDFLRRLSEPIVTYGLWKKFVAAVEVTEDQDVIPALCQVISELPQPNRDTLAYMMLHLQKVAVSTECKMNVRNLSKVFGPTIIGYSSEDPNMEHLLKEISQQTAIMQNLLSICSDYWSAFLEVPSPAFHTTLQQTPSTDSLLRVQEMFTPKRNQTIKKQLMHIPSPIW